LRRSRFDPLLAIVCAFVPDSVIALLVLGGMAQTALVWRKGKVKRVILSGNRVGEAYDEPTAMMKALIARGVPAEAIERDSAERELGSRSSVPATSTG
jgi:vancomycin permeability regulator SanA